MIYLIWYLWTLLDGQFWENKPSLGFHGEKIPQFGCCRPTHQIIDTYLWRLAWHHGGYYPTPITQNTCLGEAKRHLLRFDVMLEGVLWWWSYCTLTLDIFWLEETWIDPSTWWWGSKIPNNLHSLLQWLTQSVKTTPKGVTSSYFRVSNVQKMKMKYYILV